MKKVKAMNYSENEILSILRANHKQRIQIEFGLLKEDEITCDLTIKNWIDDCELLPWKELSKYYSKHFKIEKFNSELTNSLLPIKKKTVGDFCKFISERATKIEIKPIRLFGIDCEEAGIFRHLKNELVKGDKSANSIKPSSKLEPYMNKLAFNIVEKVNLISPNILPTISFEENEIEKQKWKLFLGGLISLILSSIINSWLLVGIGVGVLISEIWLSKISFEIPPKKFEFEGIETFRDLVERIKKHGIQR